MTTLLVIDDDKDVVNLVRFIANKEGFTILEANDGKEGVEIAEKERPDLIIMDIMMPEMDGHAATVKLNTESITKNIPVIVLTAKGNMRAAFELTANVAAYIEKPFDNKHLSDVIRKYLPKKST